MQPRLTDAEMDALEAALHEKGELFFPVKASLQGAIYGSLIRMRRLGENYNPHLGEQLISLISESHRCISEFLYKFGPDSVEINSRILGESSGFARPLCALQGRGSPVTNVFQRDGLTPNTALHPNGYRLAAHVG